MRQFSKFLAAAAFCTLAAGTAFGWGAIAVDDVEGDDPNLAGYGIVTNAASGAVADTDALAVCTAEGNVDCQLILTFQQCGAYAASTTDFGAAAAATQKAAEDRALALCGSGDCVLVISGCD